MDLRRAVVLTLLVSASTASAGEAAPAMVWTGTAPSGACKGSRVALEASTGRIWCCSAGTWAACGQVETAAAATTATSSTSSTTASTATTAAGPSGTPTLCSEGQAARGVAGAFGATGCWTPGGAYTLPAATATVLGGVKGTGSALACTAGQKALGFDSAGALQCATDADTVYTHPATHAPSIIAQDTSNRFVTDAEKMSWTAKLGAVPLPTASTVGGLRSITCSGTDKLSALGTDGIPVCSADQTGGGSYTLPDAAAGAKGGLELDTDLGGTAAAPQVVATHLASPLPQAQGGTGAGALTCSAGQHLTSNGTAYSCSADTVGGPTLAKVTGANVTNSTTTPASITGLSWSVAAATEYAFRCVITHQGTATGGPRFGISGPASPTLVNIRWQRATSATAQTQSNDTAFSAAAQTAAITSGGNTTAMTSYVYGTITNGGTAGTAQLHLTSSTAGQTVTVYRGSSCIVQ